MTILDPDPKGIENDDSYGFKDGWWFYIKSFLFNPYTIFHPKRKEKEYEPEW